MRHHFAGQRRSGPATRGRKAGLPLPTSHRADPGGAGPDMAPRRRKSPSRRSGSRPRYQALPALQHHRHSLPVLSHRSMMHQPRWDSMGPGSMGLSASSDCGVGDRRAPVSVFGLRVCGEHWSENPRIPAFAGMTSTAFFAGILFPRPTAGTTLAIIVRASVARAMSRNAMVHPRPSGNDTAPTGTQYCGVGRKEGSAFCSISMPPLSAGLWRFRSFTLTDAARWSNW